MLREMKGAVAAFFDLPLQEKRKYTMVDKDLEVYGQGCVVSEEQKLDWGDMMFLMTFPLKHWRFIYWPLAMPGFKYVTARVSTERTLAAKVE